ncbi:MAG: hypothetical protein WCK73_00120 [Deltaproteobacteria bacterium]
MILHPSVLALVGSALLVGALLVYSAFWGARIVQSWDLSSGSELQLALERRTHLISTLLGYVLVFGLASLFLFVFTADSLAPLFTGAMCAAGSLHASRYGYPTLLLQIGGFALAAIWLIVNRADSLGYDYPLVRFKYRFLLALTPVLLAETALRAAYFLDLKPEVITSCCGSLFGSGGRGFGSDLAGLPPSLAGGVFVALLLGANGARMVFRISGRGGWLLGALSALSLPVGLAAVVSWLSPYVYELPTHHCPFCLLQGEYHWIGYPLYAALLGGSLTGAGVGVLMPFRSIPSLDVELPAYQRRLAGWSVALLTGLGLLVGWIVATSHLRTS